MDIPSSDDRPVWDVWLSPYLTPALVAADELSLFEAIDERPATAEELAERLGLNAKALKALLPLLASMGFLAVKLGRYQVTDTARLYLRRDSPLYWGHAFAIHRQGPYVERILAALRADPVQALKLFGEDSRPAESWASGQLDPQMAKMLCAFMDSHSMPAALGLAANPQFEPSGRLLDVGGGSGCFSIALAKRRPALRCTVMELAVVCDLTQGYIDAAGASAQVDVLAVDMFREAWPAGYDAVFMSNIFHDWDEPVCAKLARHAFEALPPGGRIHLHEMLIEDDGSGPLPAAAFAMQMLIGTLGRQYSAAELARLLEDAGFVDITAAPAYGYFSLVTGFKR